MLVKDLQKLRKTDDGLEIIPVKDGFLDIVIPQMDAPVMGALVIRLTDGRRDRLQAFRTVLHVVDLLQQCFG